MMNFVGNRFLVGVIVLTIGVSFYSYSLIGEIRLKEAEYRTLEARYTALNSVIEANKVEFEANMKRAEKEQKEARDGYEKRIKDLRNWRVENGKIDCKSGLDFANNYEF